MDDTWCHCFVVGECLSSNEDIAAAPSLNQANPAGSSDSQHPKNVHKHRIHRSANLADVILYIDSLIRVLQNHPKLKVQLLIEMQHCLYSLFDQVTSMRTMCNRHTPSNSVTVQYAIIQWYRAIEITNRFTLLDRQCGPLTYPSHNSRQLDNMDYGSYEWQLCECQSRRVCCLWESDLVLAKRAGYRFISFTSQIRKQTCPLRPWLQPIWPTWTK